nr:hypothetical protein [Tanacetum cinerariifolium]
MTGKYCPQGEIKKLEIELWNLKFVADETEKIDKYVSRLPDNIYGRVKASKPKTLDETIELANDLMDQKLHTYAKRQSNNKSKADESFRNNHGHQQQTPKRQNVTKIYNMGTGERKSYSENLPKAHDYTSVRDSSLVRLRPRDVELLLDVIKNGNSILKTQTVNNVETAIPLTTAEEELQRRNKVKARSTLMMGLPNEHQLKFNSFKDAKSLLEVIKKSTNTQNMAFVSSSSNNSSSNNGVNTAQGVNTANGVNTASSQVNAISSLNIDNLSDVVICAFLASQHNSTHLVNEYQQIHPDDLEEMDLKWKMAMLTMRARRFLKNTGRKLNLNKNDPVAFDQTKAEERPRNYALMAYSTSSASSIDSECQIMDNCKKGLGYNAVPPPHRGLFPPLKSDLSSTGLEELFNEPETKKSTDKSNDVEPESVRKNSDALIIEDWVSDDEEEDVEKKEVKPSIKRINFVKATTNNNPREKVKKDYKEIDGGYVAFGGNPKGEKITGKGDIKKNVLFTDTKCIVLSTDFKLIDENQILLRAIKDESKLWYKRLGHLIFKTINKLVKGNLVRGLPSKIFENDQSCVACQEGKQYKASCKTKVENSINTPLHLLHMDLFGPTFVKSLNKKMYCLVVTDDFSRFTWVFFLGTKDETSGTLKSFITRVENLLNLRVKVIRCDNGTEFKNKEMNQLCEVKGIIRHYSVARTPQQNGVAKRRNRTLIKEVKTMLADSKMPTTFWAEAVDTACYVQNRVLVTKPHNKTPYEFFHGITHAISFLRPFACLVTILNTIDHLGKFDGKANDGFVRYSLNSKAFRVFNSRTRIMKEKLHVRFSENTPNNVGSEPNWLFDIDALTKTMNYQPVVAQSNDFSGTKASNDVGKEKEPNRYYILLPLWNADSPFSTTSKSSHDNEFQPSNDGVKKVDKDLRKENECNDQREEDSTNSTKRVNTVTSNINAASSSRVNVVEVEFHNLDFTFLVSPIPTTKIHKDHPLEQVIRDLHSTPQTRRTSKNLEEHGLQVKQKKEGIFISQDKFVVEILKKFRFSDVKKASTPMETSKPLLKDKDGEEVDTVVVNSTTEAEYVAASSCCSQVLWIQNQLLDYGETFKNDGFEQIVDFINANQIKYALTVSPTIYGKKVVINEASIRHDIKLNDAEGTSCLSNSVIFEELGRMSSTLASAIICLTNNQKFNFSKYILDKLKKNLEADVPFYMFPRFIQVIRKYKHRRKERKETKVFPTKIHTKDHVSKTSNDPLPNGEDRMQLKELINLCTYLSNKILDLENKVIEMKSSHKAKIAELESRVEKLEEENMSLTKELESFNTRVESPAIEKTVIDKEESSKQGRKIANIDVDAKVNLENMYNLGMAHEKTVLSMQDVDVQSERIDVVKEVTDVKEVAEEMVESRKAQIAIDEEVARRIEAEWNADMKENIDWNEVVEQVQSRQSDVVRKYQALKRKPVSVAQARKNMMIYLKNMTGFKVDFFKGISYEKTRPLFEEEYNKVQTLLKEDPEMDAERIKALRKRTRK